MKKKLTVQEYVVVASMLFGLFFGAGNLIFPVHMGQMAGSQLVPATLGFLITGVGLPLLSVAALGISKSEGLFDLSRKVSRPYAYFFTCLLYLTIGPFFAIPRCATTAFTVGIEQAVPQAAEQLRLWLLVFSAVFFAAALLFSLFPGKILTWVGKILNPFFLLFLGILIIVALVKPSAAISAVAPEGAYASQALSTGFLEGYNTMDVLAGLAFGIIVVQVIRELGVTDADAVASSTVKAGVFSSLLMALIYLAVTVVGAQSRGLFATSENGGIAGADCPALSRQCGSCDSGGNGDAGLPQNVGRSDHELCGDFLQHVPEGSKIPCLGGFVHADFLCAFQLRTQHDHLLLRAGSDVPVPACHRAGAAGAVRKILSARPRGLYQRHRLHAVGGAL